MSYNQEKIKPYSQEGEKVQQVEAMFDGIAPTYDFLNHALSMGIDRGWRRKAVQALGKYAPKRVLDVATGTGDFAILVGQLLRPQQVVGADISICAKFSSIFTAFSPNSSFISSIVAVPA